MKKRKKKSIMLRSILILGVISTAASTGYFYIKDNSSVSVINQGVYVENINLGGKKPSEAETLIQEQIVQTFSTRKIKIQTSNKTYVLDCSKLEPAFNIDETVAKAFSYGKEGNIIENIISKKSDERRDFKLSLTYNSKPLDELIDKIEKENSRSPVNAKLKIENGQVKITPEVEGERLLKGEIKEEIAKQMNSQSTQDITIKASYEAVKPEITYDILSAANTLISSFNTNFSTSIPNRINNIELAVKSINGKVIMPGETFSFNEIVGERTKARGYKEAGVIVGDKVESGLGGGICQVSSTLYNAILKAGLRAEERRNHSLPLSYVSKGLDATVDYGNIDFKFKNTLNTPLYIEGYTNNKNVYFNIYSNKELTKKKYEMSTDVYGIVQPSVKYTDNPNLDESKTQIVKNGSEGYKVKVYRKTFENGKLLNTELISDDYYMAVDREISRGIKKVGLN